MIRQHENGWAVVCIYIFNQCCTAPEQTPALFSRHLALQTSYPHDILLKKNRKKKKKVKINEVVYFICLWMHTRSAAEHCHRSSPVARACSLGCCTGDNNQPGGDRAAIGHRSNYPDCLEHPRATPTSARSCWWGAPEWRRLTGWLASRARRLSLRQ